MPTYAIEVRNNGREDGRYPVYIRLTHNRQLARIPTGVYVARNQLKRDLSTIKDPLLLREFNDNILEYEQIIIKKVGTNIMRYTARQLADIIINYNSTPDGENIDFGGFCKDYLRKLRKNGQMGLVYKRESAFYNFATFLGTEHISIKEVNVRNLSAFIEYLSKPHKVRSVSCKGDVIAINKKGCKPQTVKDYIAGLQTLFNAACDKYNDEDADMILISHNPFKSKKLQVEVKEMPAKRDMSVEDLVKILTAKDLPSQKMELARDVCAISFYLLGMNTADIFGADAKIKVRRIEYHRQKTASRRKDEALFSVKIEPEIMALLRKYRDPKKKRLFKFYTMYSTYQGFNQNINVGCKALAKHLGLEFPLTTYYMRHTWATLASEECGCSDEEIALALNHIGAESDIKSGRNLRVTRGYIHRKFKKNDINHRKVLDLVASKIG